MGRQAYGVWGIRMEKGDLCVGMATYAKDIKRPWKKPPSRADAAIAGSHRYRRDSYR